MNWFNYYGLAIMAAVMLPNIVYAVTHKDGFANAYKNKVIEVSEQIGRYGCFVFMIFNVPYTWLWLWFPYALTVYIAVNGALVLAYALSWALTWKRNGGMARALALSVIPSVIFVFSGVIIVSAPLIVCAVILSIAHIWLSVKNARAAEIRS